jgi:hypothetical protein
MNRPYVNTLLYPTYRCCGCPQLLELGIIFWTLRVSGWQTWMFSLYILRSHIDNQSISHRIGYTIRWLVGPCSQNRNRTCNGLSVLSFWRASQIPLCVSTTTDIASTNSATWLCFPTMRLLVSSYFGFLFLKNLRGIPHENSQHYWEGLCQSLYPTMSHSRRRHSAESFLKSWFEDTEYLLLIVVRTGLEPVSF